VVVMWVPAKSYENMRRRVRSVDGGAGSVLHQPPTSNLQHPEKHQDPSFQTSHDACWLIQISSPISSLDVRCWMLDVELRGGRGSYRILFLASLRDLYKKQHRGVY